MFFLHFVLSIIVVATWYLVWWVLRIAWPMHGFIKTFHMVYDMHSLIFMIITCDHENVKDIRILELCFYFIFNCTLSCLWPSEQLSNLVKIICKLLKIVSYMISFFTFYCRKKINFCHSVFIFIPWLMNWQTKHSSFSFRFRL